jgi:hypothetical protein
MRIRCPHCHNPLEIVDDSTLRAYRTVAQVPDVPDRSFSLPDDQVVTHTTKKVRTPGRHQEDDQVVTHTTKKVRTPGRHQERAGGAANT